jgi:hypothetical protein
VDARDKPGHDENAKKNPPFAGLTAATKPLPFVAKAMAMLLFLPGPRHPMRARPHFRRALLLLTEPGFPGAAGFYVMQQAAILFWSAPSRIGRRLAQFVAIAAASLPDVGV